MLTLQKVMTITTTLNLSLRKKERAKRKPTCILVFLDVTKAYDKAWSKAIMYALDRSATKVRDWIITKNLNGNLTARI